MRKIIKARRRRPEEEAQQGRPARHPFSGLTADQLTDLEIGCNSSVFANDAARRAAYTYYREDLLREALDGRRPAAFWDYEPGIPVDCRAETEADFTIADRLRTGTPKDDENFVLSSGHGTAILAHEALARRRKRWLAGQQDRLEHPSR
jgi:hypothetical protein